MNYVRARPNGVNLPLNSSWTHGVLSVKEIGVLQACVVVNVKTGGVFF